MMNPYSKELNSVTTSATPSAGGGDLEAKLQGVAASLRRERDEAHRRKQLAEERLKLAQEEAAAADRSTADLKEKLAELEYKSGEKALQKIETLKQEVNELTNQVEFQHKELLQMREKKKNMMDLHAAEAAKRQTLLTRLNDGIVVRREKLRVAEAVPPVMKPDPKFLLAELKGDVDGSLALRWPSILTSKAQDISKLTHKMEETSDGIELIIAGYQTKFGFAVDKEEDGEDSRKTASIAGDDSGSTMETSSDIGTSASDATNN